MNYGEPWNFEEYLTNEYSIITVNHPDYKGKLRIADAYAEEDAEHIVACINFCTGWSNEQLAYWKNLDNLYEELK